MEHRTKTILVNCFRDDYPQIWETLADGSVEIEAEFADARSAIDTVRLSQHEERLCVVHITGPDQVQQLRWLSESFIGRPVMALVDGDSAPDLVFAVNRAGAAQVLPLPLQADDLRAALHSLRLRHSPQQPVAARRVVAVSGVTGGCGATTIAINLAYEIAHRFDLSCILTELTSLGMIAACLNVEARRTTHDLLCDIDSVDAQNVQKTLCQITDHLHILPAPSHGAETLNASPADVVRLIELLKQLADVVVLDLPVNQSAYFGAFDATDQVILVAEQAVPSLRALGCARERLGMVEHLRQTLLINRYDPHKKGFPVSHLQRLLQTPQLVTIANDYGAVSASLNEGRPLRQQAPNSRALADIDKLAQMLISPAELTTEQLAPKRGRLKRALCALLGL